MIINSNLKRLLPLIAIAVATTSCQLTNSIKNQAGKNPQQAFSENDVGEGAVASQ